jgi:predicted RNA binding protein YcfA (HicA-like mRNA interferase family)
VTKRDKLLDKLKQSPHNVTFDDVRRVLEDEGFQLNRVSGSHHIFKKGEMIFVVPSHGKRVKVFYVKRLVEIVEKYGGS